MLEDRAEEWEQTIDVNIKGLLYTTRAVLGDMPRRKDGHIVNVGSVTGGPRPGHYPAGTCVPERRLRLAERGARLDHARLPAAFVSAEPRRADS